MVILMSQITAQAGVSVLMAVNDVLTTTLISMQDITDRFTETSIISYPLVIAEGLANSFNNFLPVGSMLHAISDPEGEQVSKL